MSRVVVIFIFLTSVLVCSSQWLFAEGSLEAGLHQAALYGKEEKFDFAFMELRDLLRRYPESPQVPEMEFSLAEYLFLQQNVLEAKEGFLRCLSHLKQNSIPRFLTQVYLLLCLEKTGGSGASGELLAQLKQALSSQTFFEAFDDRRTHSWKSLLGIHYTLHEFVDRLEIFQNGELLYTVTLP